MRCILHAYLLSCHTASFAKFLHERGAVMFFISSARVLYALTACVSVYTLEIVRRDD